jgi:NADPH-dependent 2,4-dienoyl-CoA reductase/sulfur reductase-like enzyme
MPRIVIIGGVAAGMSAASQAKRRDTQAEVIALERGDYVSYGACGMPYNIADDGRAMRDLVVITPEQFRHTRGIDVRVGHEVMSIDAQARSLRVRDHVAPRDYELTYDELVIATGATAVRPPLPGIGLPGVFVLRELSDGAAIKSHLEQNDVQRALIIGGGYIGMEMAEALRARGVAVTLVERAIQVLPGFEPVIAEVVRETLQRHGVQLMTGVTIEAIEQDGDELSVRAGGQMLTADMVLLALGVRPNVDLAQAAGVALGASGAIAVDDRQRTNLPHVYAAGDCAEAYHRVLKQPVFIPLGTTANKQGKVAGANAAGADEHFQGIVGTAAFKVFDMEVARAGVGAADIQRHGLQVVSAVSRHNSRGHHFPGAARITTVVFAERGSGRLLGAQMVGADVVAKRMDVLATALHAGMTMADIEGLDLSYAPPLAPVYDPVLIAASVARKALDKAS